MVHKKFPNRQTMWIFRTVQNKQKWWRHAKGLVWIVCIFSGGVGRWKFVFGILEKTLNVQQSPPPQGWAFWSKISRTSRLSYQGHSIPYGGALWVPDPTCGRGLHAHPWGDFAVMPSSNWPPDFQPALRFLVIGDSHKKGFLPFFWWLVIHLVIHLFWFFSFNNQLQITRKESWVTFNLDNI